MSDIRLRPLEPEDLDVLYDIENELELWSAGYTTVPYSRYILHDYIANSTCDIYSDRQMRLMAETLEGDVVGIVDITDYEPRHNRAEVGVVVKKEFRNHGYGQQMIAEIVSYSRNVIHLHQLYAVVAANNEMSLEMFRKCGFKLSHYLNEWLFDGEKYEKAAFLTFFL